METLMKGWARRITKGIREYAEVRDTLLLRPVVKLYSSQCLPHCAFVCVPATCKGNSDSSNFKGQHKYPEMNSTWTTGGFLVVR